jgi:hypothetical protein
VIVDDKDKQLPDEANPEDVNRAIIEALRENDGAKLRTLLRALRNSDDPNANELYERIVRDPALRDLVPH